MKTVEIRVKSNSGLREITTSFLGDVIPEDLATFIQYNIGEFASADTSGRVDADEPVETEEEDVVDDPIESPAPPVQIG